MSKIKAGDVVVLKCKGNSPVMTVGYVWSKSINNQCCDMAYCQWFDGNGVLKEHSFIMSSLEVCNV